MERNNLPHASVTRKMDRRSGLEVSRGARLKSFLETASRNWVR
jgi:hypothetical protein